MIFFLLTLIPWVLGFIFLPTLTFIAVLFIGIVYLHHLVLFRFRFRFGEKEMFMYFGLPGSGKTTVCAEIIRQINNAKKGTLSKIRSFCNFPVKGAFKLNREDIGNVDFRDDNHPLALLCIDEASTVYFKRNAVLKVKDSKTGQMRNAFSDAENIFHSMHRHYKTMEVLFAQSWDGVDLRLRELSTGLYYVEPSRLRNIIKIRKIVKIFTIREDDHQPCDGYEFERFSSRYIWAPPAWKMFDTYDAPTLQYIDAERWYQ